MCLPELPMIEAAATAPRQCVPESIQQPLETTCRHTCQNETCGQEW